MNKLSEEMDQVEFYEVDVDHSSDLAQRFSVMSIPALILFKEGEETDRMTGFAPEDQVKQFASQ